MLGSALDVRRTESRRVILSAQSGTRATSAKRPMVAFVVLLAGLALLILLSPLMVDPAVMPGRRYASPEERASAFAEISGSLLDRYAEAGDRAGSARGAVGDTRPQTSTGIDAVPPPLPPPIAPSSGFACRRSAYPRSDNDRGSPTGARGRSKNGLVGSEPKRL
jgi:hypothetical protein